MEFLTTCGDIEQDITNFRNFGATVVSEGVEGPPAVIALPCQDLDNDQIADVGLCTTWDNQIGSSPSCTAAIMTVPITASKCNCNVTSIGAITFLSTCTTDADCNDGDPCSTGDVCVGTTCTGTAVTCTAQDQCHDAGICDFATGLCTNPAKADGSACVDGLSCTDTDTCVGGSCTGEDSCDAGQMCTVDGCIELPTQCTINSDCNDQNPCTTEACLNGTCSYANNNLSCNDGNACTTNDQCSNGSCVPGAPIICNAPGTCQVGPGTCVAGTCSYNTAADGTSSGSKKSCQDGACLSIGECERVIDCPVVECLSVSCIGGSCIYDSTSSDGKSCGIGGVCHESTCAACNKTTPCSEANLCNLASCTR